MEEHVIPKAVFTGFFNLQKLMRHFVKCVALSFDCEILSFENLSIIIQV